MSDTDTSVSLHPCALCGYYDDPANLEVRDNLSVHKRCADGPEPRSGNYPPVEMDQADRSYTDALKEVGDHAGQ